MAQIDWQELTAHPPASPLGGKAAGLSRLIAMGLNVPKAIAIGVNEDESVKPTWTSRAARAVLTWADKNGLSNLVVRSSTPGEDDSASSAAGIYASAFSLPTIRGLSDAIHCVNNSVSSPSATAYRTQLGAARPDSWGIIVQAAVYPVSSGVTFSWSSGVTSRLISEATWGLSASLLSGESKGDSFSETDGTLTHTLREKSIAAYPSSRTSAITVGDFVSVPIFGASQVERTYAKVVHIVDAEGLVYVRLPDDASASSTLPPVRYDVVGSVARRVATEFPLGVDLEWAFDSNGTLWALQARPITKAIPESIPHQAHRASGRIEIFGEPAAPGQATGPLVAHSAEPGNVVPGAVVACGPATPALVPILLEASGIASSDAGILSHVAIVGRELGKPCVVGLTGVLDVFEPGQVVSLDGSRGSMSDARGGPKEKARQPQWGLRAPSGLNVDLWLSPADERPGREPEQMNVVILTSEWVEALKTLSPALNGREGLFGDQLLFLSCASDSSQDFERLPSYCIGVARTGPWKVSFGPLSLAQGVTLEGVLNILGSERSEGDVPT